MAIPEEAKDLIRFLASAYLELDDLRYKAIALPDNEIKDFIIMHWPVIQGTRNQFAIKMIGKQQRNGTNVAKAIKEMLKYGDIIKPTKGE